MTHRHVIVILAFFLGGCSSTLKMTDSEAATADYGAYPSDYQSLVQTYYSVALKDPYSAHFNFYGEPVKGYTRKAPVAGGGVEQFGYVVTFGVNAKNSFGGYVGEQVHKVFIRNGRVLQEFGKNPWFSEPWYQ